MKIKTEKEEYEKDALELIGHSISKVTYFEIDYNEPGFLSNDHHSLDYGLQFDLSNGKSFYMIWDSQKVQYDLKLKSGQLTNELNPDSNTAAHDVSSLQEWAERINQKITSIESYWSFVRSSALGQKTWYPQDLEIKFDNGLNTIISAIEVTSEGQIYAMADHISIFFDTETASKYGAKNKK